MAKPTESDIDTDFRAAYDTINLKYDEAEPPSQVARKNMWFIKDLKKVAMFLYGEEPFMQALDALEADMQTLYKQRSGKATLSKINLRAIAQSWTGPTVPANSAFLLQSVLAANEVVEKFGGIEDVDGKLHPMRFFGNLSNEGFAANIKARHLAVDYVGGDHGEYTHRIQWYCIAKKAAELGLECRTRYDKVTGQLFERSGPVWVKVFDRTDASDINDFRRPEKLNLYLGSPTDASTERWPLLTGFLKSRREVTSGYTVGIKTLLVAKHAYELAVKDDFMRMNPIQTTNEIVRLRTLPVKPLTEAIEKEIAECLEKNKVLTGRDKFYVGSSEKPI
jgi:hypothetical protein